MATDAWENDVDAALERARTNNRLLLLDFSAAPAAGGKELQQKYPGMEWAKKGSIWVR